MDPEIAALLRLLQDEDDSVRAEALNRLSQRAADLEALRQAGELKDLPPAVEEILLERRAEIALPSWYPWMHGGDETRRLEAAWVGLSRMAFGREADSLGLRLLALRDAFATSGREADLDGLTGFLFDDLHLRASLDVRGFRPAHLHSLLDDREGLPLTLATLGLLIARPRGIRCFGLAAPGLFLLAGIQGKNVKVCDLVERRLLTDAEVSARLFAGEGRAQAPLRPASAYSMVQRGLRNLMRLEMEAGRPRASRLYRRILLELGRVVEEDEPVWLSPGGVVS